MSGLDSSFEALAFIPVNLSPLFSAFVHNIWPWLAFITAAFSFWRLTHRTTSSCIPLSPPPPRTLEKTAEGGVPFVDWTTSFDDEEEEREDEDEEVKQQGKGVVGVALTRGNSSSNKFFTVYYEEETNDDNDDDDHVNDDEHHDRDDDEEEEGERKSDRVVIKRWGSSGSTVEMRRSSSSLTSSSTSSSSSSSSGEYDLGWYTYQDRKVIDGSVVKLWKEERESGGVSGGSPRSCRRRCLVGLTMLA